MERPRRERRPDSRREALAKLKEAQTGKRRIDQIEFKNDDVYQEVTEEEYQKIVAERRAAGFIEEDEDDDLGYADDGEEDWSADGPKKQKISKVAMIPKQKQKEEALKPTARVSHLFLGSKSVIGPDQDMGVHGDGELDPEEQERLQSLLDQLNDTDDVGMGEEKTRSRTARMMDVAIFGQSRQLADLEIELDQERERAEQEMDAFGVDLFSRQGQGGSEEIDWSVLSAPQRRLPRPTLNSGTSSDQDARKAQLAYLRADDDAPQEDYDEDVAENKNEKSSFGYDESQGGDVSLEAVKTRPAPPSLQMPPVVPTAMPLPDALATEPMEPTEGIKTPFELPQNTDDRSPLGEGGLVQLFWIDAYENRDKDGSVFLFGKAALPNKKETASCCIRVQNLERNVFLLPRIFALSDPHDDSSVTDKRVGMGDVYQEIKDILIHTLGVKKFGAKPVNRKYCFAREDQLYNLDGSDRDRRSLLNPDLGVPVEGQYLKVVYSAGKPLPIGLRGRTFSACFGCQSSGLELFLLKRDMMGPQWLTIKDCQPVEKEQQLSWCKFEFVVDSQKAVQVMKDPPDAPELSVLSLSLTTEVNPRTHRNEVVMVTGRFHQQVNIDGMTNNPNQVTQFTAVRQMPGVPWPFDLRVAMKKKDLKIFLHPNERGLLSWLSATIHRLDPDVLVGHELHSFIMEVLVHRMDAAKIVWSKLGRLKRKKIPGGTSGGSESKEGGEGGMLLVDKGIAAGRILCDTEVAAKELVRERSYTLTELARVLLHQRRVEVDATTIPTFFNATQTILRLVALSEKDAELALSLMFKLEVLPLTKVLTSLCGNLWQRSLRSARAERVEYLLLHEFHRLKYIVPEKITGRQRREKDQAKAAARGKDSAAERKGGGRKKKAAYSGGLVLEPKKGFYDKFVLLLDFNSLYPSIVREFNLCFTTVKHWEMRDEGGVGALPSDDSSAGVLPKVINRLLERRKAVKKLMKTERDPAKTKTLDIRQKALKLVANSMYGCLGFDSSRFYCEPIAALITSQGREILQRTVDMADSLGHPVIYGDTDSIMINTKEIELQKVLQVGRLIKQEVNKRYKVLEIDIDGIYKNMLLLRKKKYAALKVVDLPDGSRGVTRELKGLDMVRRDWSDLSKDVGNYVLDLLLEGKASREEIVDQIHAQLLVVREEVNAGKIPLQKFVITKSLTKAPADYPDAKNLPHVQVAIRRTKAGKTVKVGDSIEYVVCKGDDSSVSGRSYHPDEVEASGGSLQIDYHWYLSNQVLPPVARLVAPIEETDAARIAHCLGLDPSRFQNFSKDTDTGVARDDDDALLGAVEDEEEKWKDCEPLTLTCPKCATKFPYAGVFAIPKGDKQAEGVVGPVPAPLGLTCPTFGCSGFLGGDGAASRGRLMNVLTLATRKHIDQYYEGWYKCSDSICRNRSRQISVKSDKCWFKGCNGVMLREYPAVKLYQQLSYLCSLFDADTHGKKLAVLAKQREASPGDGVIYTPEIGEGDRRLLGALHSHMLRQLADSCYHYIDLAALFKTVHALS